MNRYSMICCHVLYCCGIHNHTSGYDPWRVPHDLPHYGVFLHEGHSLLLPQGEAHVYVLDMFLQTSLFVYLTCSMILNYMFQDTFVMTFEVSEISSNCFAVVICCQSTSMMSVLLYSLHSLLAGGGDIQDRGPLSALPRAAAPVSLRLLHIQRFLIIGDNMSLLPSLPALMAARIMAVYGCESMSSSIACFFCFGWTEKGPETAPARWLAWSWHHSSQSTLHRAYHSFLPNMSPKWSQNDAHDAKARAFLLAHMYFLLSLGCRIWNK